MSSDPQRPKADNFQYVYIPCEASLPTKSFTFTGNDDGEFRELLQSHFRQTALSSGQRADFESTLMSKVKDHGSQGKAQATEMVGAMTDMTSFEIVPIVLPKLSNKFIGTSLYIDDAGRFKELPLNDRASKVAQRDIRGDGFLCANHDDPALEAWERVDCSMADFQSLHDKPPTQQLNTGNQGDMFSAGMMRDNQAKAITQESFDAAMGLKEEGNASVAKQDFSSAVQFYTRALEEQLVGRSDLFPDGGTACETLRTACYSNRALCHVKLCNFFEGEKDAVVATQRDGANAKAWYRRATAACGMKDYDGARVALQRTIELNGGTVSAECASLSEDIEKRDLAHRQAERARMAKMFS